MSVCTVCSYQNQVAARFCVNCGAMITAPSAPDGATRPLPAPDPPEQDTEPRWMLKQATRPTPDDDRWLAATLMHSSPPGFMASAREPDTAPLTKPDDQQEQKQVMDETHPLPDNPVRYGGRYEVTPGEAPAEPGTVVVVDREPWQVCWACGSTANKPGEAFCTNCGASLIERTYHGVVWSQDTPQGIAIVPLVSSETARALLPPVLDVVEHGDETLIVLAPQEATPVVPPLDELASLRVGLGLARLLEALHQQELILGRVDIAHLATAVDGTPRLLRVPMLRQREGPVPPAVVAAELHDLAALLEELTATPRTTRRLQTSDEPAATESAEPALSRVLSQVRTGQITQVSEFATRLQTLLADQTSPMPLRQQHGAASHTGMVRDHNEDSLLCTMFRVNNVSQDYCCGLYAVADGMGGHAAGEIASYLAVRTATETVLSRLTPALLNPTTPYEQERISEVLTLAVNHANEAVHREATSRGNDMGTTLTLALVIGDRATIANVGDSRTYLLHNGTLRRVTQDHSLVMRLVEIGHINEQDIYTHPQRNAVLRSLGEPNQVEVDIFVETLHPDDALLLCSDGLWEMVHDPQLQDMLNTDPDPENACQSLIVGANRAGGEDNVTAVLVRFATAEPAA